MSRLIWDGPRNEGIEIRVYGVTKCFRTDAAEGTCLREHTALPDEVRMLLAKGPASKGKLSWPQGEDEVETKEGCAYVYLSENGTAFYSIVAATYNGSGHSIFGIVDEGYYDAEECGIDLN